jgi:hypothetical protein
MYLVPIDIYNKLLDVIDEREKRKIDDLNRNQVGNEDGAFPNLPPPPINVDPGTSPMAYSDSDEGRYRAHYDTFAPEIDLPSGEELEINQDFGGANISEGDKRVIDSAEVRARLMEMHSDADSDDSPMVDIQRNKRRFSKDPQARYSREGALKRLNLPPPVDPKGSVPANAKKGKTLAGHAGAKNVFAKNSKTNLITPQPVINQSTIPVSSRGQPTVYSQPTITPNPEINQSPIPINSRMQPVVYSQPVISHLPSAASNSRVEQAGYSKAALPLSVPAKPQIIRPQIGLAPVRTEQVVPPDNEGLIGILEEGDEVMPEDLFLPGDEDELDNVTPCEFCGKKLPLDLIDRHEIICMEYRERVLRQKKFLKKKKSVAGKEAGKETSKRNNDEETGDAVKKLKNLGAHEDPSDLDDESKFVNPRKDLTCLYCRESFKSVQERKKHELLCGKQLERIKQGKALMKVRNNPTTGASNSQQEKDAVIECKFCPMTFNKTSALHRHILLAHKADKNYKSLINQGLKRNAEKAGLEDRGKRKTKAPNKLYCLLCTDHFDKYDRLIRHIKNIHEADENYVSNLMQGQKRKTDEAKLPERGKNKSKPVKVFSCKFCDSSYTTKHSLNRHIRNIHDADPGYKSSLPQGEKRKRDPPAPGDPEHYDNWN